MADRTPQDYLTVTGLIAELQRQIEIDPERADQPVVFFVAGRSGHHPAVVAVGMGVGHEQRVGVLCHRR